MPHPETDLSPTPAFENLRPDLKPGVTLSFPFRRTNLPQASMDRAKPSKNFNLFPGIDISHWLTGALDETCKGIRASALELGDPNAPDLAQSLSDARPRFQARHLGGRFEQARQDWAWRGV
ncbi:MAG: hypothetical protein JO288_14435 [Hyphomicrobiales bacterium]|nr:hypothetical protein [Hyphomicrobiales bacterium]